MPPKKYPFLPFSAVVENTFFSRSPILFYFDWETVRDSLEENQLRIGRSPVFS
jgi:hypothetical protein